MFYKSYQHIEKLGTSETEGILKGEVHLFGGLSPQESIPVVMKTLKGVSARLLNSKHKNELSKVLYGGHIWSPSYYIATIAII